ncbi:MAG: hypothetical protein F6K00_19600 [Leptolyngbya sp. SIOISBB]|nr:hypothetical protein [Leptolyngbya sp. SIOISBB]
MADYAQILALVERYDRAIDGLEQQVIDRVNAALDASFRELEQELRRTYPQLQDEGGLYNFVLKTEKFNQLKGLLDEILPPRWQADIEALYTEAFQLASDTGIDLAGNLVEQIDPAYPLDPFSGIPVEAIAAQARDGVKRLYRYNDTFAQRASAIVELGLAQGHGTAKVAAELGRELGLAKSKAETIARTEIISVFSDSADARYLAADIGFFQWLVNPSEGTCILCYARNGRVYKVGAVRIPAHPRGRCFKLPWRREWQQKGLTDDKWLREYRQRGLEELKTEGFKPDYGPTYWEKKAGMDKAPEVIWSP